MLSPRRKVAATLYAEVPPAHFPPTGLGDLQVALARQTAALTFIPVTSPDQLYLLSDGTTKQGGWRYTVPAMRHLSQHVTPYLLTILRKALSSSHAAIGRVAAAADIFNTIIRHLFEPKTGLYLVCDEPTRSILGVSRAAANPVDNAFVLQTILEYLEAAGCGYTFRGAVLVGLGLSLWFRAPQPVVVVQRDGRPHNFYEGIYARFGEDQSALAFATGKTILCRAGSCLSLLSQRRGMATVAQIQAMLHDAMARTVDAAAVHTRVLEWQQQRLAKRVTTKMGCARFMRQGQRTLMTYGLRAEEAKCVLARLAAPDDVRDSWMTPWRVLQTRDLYDVFCAVPALAKRYTLRMRERIEQAAYRLLTNPYANMETLL